MPSTTELIECIRAVEYDIESEWNCGIGMTVFTEESISIRASSIDSPKPSPRPPTHQLPSESRSSLPLKMDLSMDISIPAPFFPIMTRCESPTPFWECDGYCRERVPLLTAERANVVSVLSLHLTSGFNANMLCALSLRCVSRHAKMLKKRGRALMGRR